MMTNENSLKKFINILQTKRNDSTNQDRSVILFVDDKMNIWELIRRPDLNFESICDQNDVYSYTELVKNSVEFNELHNINIESTQTNSICDSDLDISRVSDFNLTNFIRESLNDI